MTHELSFLFSHSVLQCTPTYVGIALNQSVLYIRVEHMASKQVSNNKKIGGIQLKVFLQLKEK